MIQVNWDENCRACGGNGFQHNQLTGMNETCPVCKGSGHVRRGYSDGVYCCNREKSDSTTSMTESYPA